MTVVESSRRIRLVPESYRHGLIGGRTVRRKIVTRFGEREFPSHGGGREILVLRRIRIIAVSVESRRRVGEGGIPRPRDELRPVFRDEGVLVIAHNGIRGRSDVEIRDVLVGVRHYRARRGVTLEGVERRVL